MEYVRSLWRNYNEFLVYTRFSMQTHRGKAMMEPVRRLPRNREFVVGANECETRAEYHSRATRRTDGLIVVGAVGTFPLSWRRVVLAPLVAQWNTTTVE